MTLVTSGLFFLILMLFSIIVLVSANFLLLDHERSAVTSTINNVSKRFKGLDSEVTAESILQYLYAPESVTATVTDNLLYEKNISGSRIAISSLLYSNQIIYIYDNSNHLVFTTATKINEKGESHDKIAPNTGVVTIAENQGKRGYFYSLSLKDASGKKRIGYIQIFHNLEFYYTIKDRLFYVLIILVIVTIFLVFIVTTRTMKRFLNPMQDLHEAMTVIAENPMELNVRAQVESGDEIEELSLIFNDMLDKLERQSKLQNQFVSDVSHELRTPIAVIKGHLDLLQRWGKNDPEILDESLEASSYEANRMNIMISEMLDMIRIQGSFESHQHETSDIRESVQKVLGNFKVLHGDFAFKFESSANAGYTPAKIYTPHLEQALTIIVDNAVKYSPIRKEITVELQEQEEFYCLSVKDKGEGIAEEDLQHIFERFYRTDKSRNRTSTKSGLGIGLSILQQITQAYGCRLDVTSKVEQGSNFTLTIPKVVDTFDA
ncbi:HAMP domain-containing sensor histidine kinase [Streptococcus saliviloxodontae]|uniref:Signal transduction histidine-protein kinase ArlS n=1 Tax=Streptococcus saliviloxodontae TaxID=1349416 RepID=A0ABS2PJD2_9STRE|nr:HAMP domain-containing histidine kinase [Streptococcus saliviloxodontae]MBM7635456.1 signal transduction histidine kinase [Streptococcus saliviloxodontae]